MAESTTTSSSTYRYQMTLGNYIGESSPGTLTLVQGQKVLMDDSEEGVTYNVTLGGVKVNKKIYQPTEIEAEVDFVMRSTDSSGNKKMLTPSFETTKNLFVRREVLLQIIEISGTENNNNDDFKSYTVAKSCFIYEVNPKLKREGNGKKMTVKLNIFSMDKLMTINKYSKAYVARKLGSEILKPESLNFGTKSDSETPLIQTNKDGLRFLTYEEEISTTDTNGKNTPTRICTEFIQPYLVQYNESFYDFMVRTANRCGEFLYFEDGELVLGLPASDDVEVIDEYNSITERGISPDPLVITPYHFDSVKDGKGEMGDLNYENIDKNDDGFPDDVFPDHTASNAELAHDEYIYPLQKDLFDTFKRECNYDGTATNGTLWRLIPLLKTLFLSDDAATALVSWAIGGEAINTLKAYFGKSNANKDGNEAWIDPYKGTKHADSSNNKVVHFAPENPDGWTTIDYYNDIRKHEEEQQRKIVCVDMGATYANLKLGEKIFIDGLDGPYVIIQIQESSEETWDDDYKQYDTDSSDQSEGSRSLKFFAIPSYKDKNGNEQFIPPLQDVPVVRKAGPQAAFVTDNMDPKYQGRVRVAYPWQSLGSAVKQEVIDATQSLKLAKAKKLELMEQQASLAELLTEMSSETQEVIDYANADSDTRASMMESKEKEISALKEEVDELDSKCDKLLSTIDSLSAEISDLKKKKDLSESDQTTLSEKEAYLETTMQEREKTMSELEKKQSKFVRLQNQQNAMEKAAEENDQENDGSGAYNIEEDNSAVVAMKEHYQEVVGNYQECCEKIEEQEKKIGEYEKKKETVQAYYDESVKAMSSPWIRVASPMATDGGGVFFKPHVGDEVLINYDNNNIERPYVVGSLYSKNVLDPSENIQRKANPLIQSKDVSMSMISRNGHHITFTDPDYGGNFITNFLSPGIGFIASLAGLDEFGENIRDLSGGIHMGDRYNINEIELCTHKREVNIRSSLGTITLNAFNGISIDAPNADVTIKGMNINLIAGNKVNIISGNNIKEPKIDDPEGKGAYIGSLLVGTVIGGGIGVASKLFLEDTLDFSTIRRMLEIFVRPVDGTMLIKSKRYLKLEAGPGTAYVKADRYKKAKKQGKASWFFKGKATGGDTKADLELFFQAVIECVEYISKKVDEFYDTYDKLWKDAFFKKLAYNDIAKHLLKDVKEPSLNELAFIFPWNEDTLTKNTYKGYFDDNVETYMNQWIGKSEGIKYGYLEEEALAAAKALYKLVQYGKSASLFMDDIKKTMDKGDYNWVVDCAQSCINELSKGWDQKWLEYYTDNKDKFCFCCDADFVDYPDYNTGHKGSYPDPFSRYNQTIFKRKLLLAFLYRVNDSNYNENHKYIYVGYDMDYVNKTNSYRQEHYWKRQIQNIDFYQQRHKFMRTVFEETWDKSRDKFRDNFQSLDQNVWEGSKDGQILFSDREDATLNFNANGTGLDPASDANLGNMDRLKRILMGIK